MAQYMCIPNIKGNVGTKGYEDAILVSGLQHAQQRYVTQKPGTSNRDVGVANMQHMQITKIEDSASAQLYQAFYQGTVIPKLEIVRCSLLNGTAEWQSKLILTNVMIASINSFSGHHGAKEMITLAFNKIERSMRSQNSTGQYQTPKRTSYDLTTTEAS